MVLLISPICMKTSSEMESPTLLQQKSINKGFDIGKYKVYNSARKHNFVLRAVVNISRVIRCASIIVGKHINILS